MGKQQCSLICLRNNFYNFKSNLQKLGLKLKLGTAHLIGNKLVDNIRDTQLLYIIFPKLPTYTQMDKRSEKSINQTKPKDTDRAYGCPCGKTYLSYPALFTHVKQKHEGKPPGKLIKPKTGKIRGRPKTRINPEDLEQQEIIARIEHEIFELIQDYEIDYQTDFQRSEGSTTCQDVATQFVDHFENLSDNGITVLTCFLNELKSAVESKFGVEYWQKEKPTQIIDVANILYTKHEENQTTFPISKQIFKELIYNFFQWLYANKFTDHRLLKRTYSEEEKTKPNHE